MAKITITMSQERLISKGTELKRALALDWKWFSGTKNFNGPDSEVYFEKHVPMGQAITEDGFYYRYPDVDDYVYFNPVDLVKASRAKPLKADTNAVRVYELCRRYARSSNASYLKVVAELAKANLFPKAWRVIPATPLYRGLRLSKTMIAKLAKEGRLQLKSKDICSSWSSDKKIARNFVQGWGEPGVLVRKNINPKDVLIYIPAILKSLGIPGSFWDFDEEGEALVFNNERTLTILNKDVVETFDT